MSLADGNGEERGDEWEEDHELILKTLKRQAGQLDLVGLVASRGVPLRCVGYPDRLTLQCDQRRAEWPTLSLLCPNPVEDGPFDPIWSLVPNQDDRLPNQDVPKGRASRLGGAGTDRPHQAQLATTAGRTDPMWPLPLWDERQARVPVPGKGSRLAHGRPPNAVTPL